MEFRKEPICFRIRWMEGIYYQDQEFISRWPEECRRPPFIDNVMVLFENAYRSATKQKIEQEYLPLRFTRFKSGFVGENLTLEEYKSLNEEEKIRIQSKLEEKNKDWINKRFQELNAAWLTVVDGEVETHSSDIDEYPQESDILKICEKRRKFPFIFDNPRFLMIEESSLWAKTVYPDDYYPTTELRISSSSSGSMLNLTADFDTGAIEVYIDMERLISEGLITPSSPTERPREDVHLNKPYTYYRRTLSISIMSERGKIKKGIFSVICVRNWGISPFVLVNRFRTALVGRRLFQKLMPSILLKFKNRKTEVHF